MKQSRRITRYLIGMIYAYSRTLALYCVIVLSTLFKGINNQQSKCIAELMHIKFGIQLFQSSKIINMLCLAFL